MNNTMEYKGYVGSVEFSEEDGLFYGKVMGIRALISYEGATAAELVSGFPRGGRGLLGSVRRNASGTGAGLQGQLQCPHFARTA